VNPQALKSLLNAPFWSKDVAVWGGSHQALDDLLSGCKRLDLDVLDLLPDDENLPSASEDRAELLRRELEKYLLSKRPDNGSRVVLVVHNPSILVRYGVGLQPFYDWFTGNKCLTILALDRPKAIDLPTTVAATLRLESDWLLDQLRSLLAKPDNVFVETA
jgi:hypothetical protein